MAGSPKKRAMLIELQKRAVAMFGQHDDGREPTPLEYACGYIASGGTLLKLAEELGVSRNLLDDTLRNLDPSAGDKLAHARKLSADAHAELGMSLIDNALEEKGALWKAEKQAAHRKWLASKMNREVYGEEKQGVQVAISLGSLHLDALRAVKSQVLANPASAALPAPSDEGTTDYEILPSDAGNGAGIEPPSPALPPAPAGPG
jgi:hypothetical protein